MGNLTVQTSQSSKRLGPSRPHHASELPEPRHPVGPPSPIVIEKLVPAVGGARGAPSSSRSSVRFSALSEERLMAAVRLAKRGSQETTQEALRSGHHRRRRRTSTGVSNHDTSNSVDLDWAQRRSVAAGLGDGRSPPTRDPGPGPSGKNHQLQLSREIQKVQKELLVYIEKGKRQKSRWNQRRNSKAVDRLAAAHRSALRAMRVFTQQLSEPPAGKVPSHHKELSRLLRQLAQCATRVDVDLDLELGLDHSKAVDRLAAAHRSALRAMRDFLHRVVRRQPPPLRNPRGGGGGGGGAAPAPIRQPAARRQVLRAGVESLLQQGALRAEACEQLEPQKRSGRGGATLQPESSIRRQALWRGDVGFRQPTVSSQLHVNQPPPQREPSVPWVPTSPHSPPRPAPQRRSEARGPRAEHLIIADQRSQAQNEALRQAWLERTTMQRLRELNQLSQEEMERPRRAPTTTTTGPSSRQRWSEQAGERSVESAEQVSEALLEDLLDEAAPACWATDPAEGAVDEEARRRLQAPTLESMLLRMEEIQERVGEEEEERVVGEEEEERVGEEEEERVGEEYEEEEGREKEREEEEEERRGEEKEEGRGGGGRRSQGEAVSSGRPASPQPIRLTRPVQRHSPVPHILLERPVETG
ncbi:LOW QUALITY PROTEIN: hypothetical protein CRUP_015270 [Coryphaenoides rupestris]|nr:LOW QUALITY PROTEIN: hypothetical protein CRUP_015270 [Coryphaenoides rupestris]